MSLASLPTEAQGSLPKVLVVPHNASSLFRVRGSELAYHLRPFAHVFTVEWPDFFGEDVTLGIRGTGTRLLRSLSAATQRIAPVAMVENHVRLRAPILQPYLFHRIVGRQRADRIARARNGQTLAKIIMQIRPDAVLVPFGMFDLSRVRHNNMFQDVFDWIDESAYPRAYRDFMFASLADASQYVRGTLVVSSPLAAYISQMSGISTEYLPNGVDLAAMRAVSSDAVYRLRQRLGLHGAFVIGYIGNHGSFSGLDFLLDAFSRVRRRIPEARLLIVGPTGGWRKQGSALPPGVITTGAVPRDDINVFFHAIDVGVLAKEPSTFTEYAFHIKVVEYSAARKFTLVPPFPALQELGWPNLVVANYDAARWADALVELKNTQWKSEWDEIVHPYDWSSIASHLATRCGLSMPNLSPSPQKVQGR